MEQFPSKVLRLLDARDENQAKLSRATKIDPSQLAKWLKGRGLPSVKQLLAIARYLDVSLDYLADDALDAPATAGEKGMRSEEWYVLEVIRAMGLDFREAVSRLTGAGRVAGPAGGMPTVATRNEDEQQARDDAARLGLVQSKANGN